VTDSGHATHAHTLSKGKWENWKLNFGRVIAKDVQLKGPRTEEKGKRKRHVLALGALGQIGVEPRCQTDDDVRRHEEHALEPICSVFR
jgi:hypothetical protein